MSISSSGLSSAKSVLSRQDLSVRSEIQNIHSFPLLDAKEVLDLQLAILLEIGTVNSVERSIVTESPADSVGSETFGDFRIHGPAELPEAIDGIFLSDFHDDAWPEGHVLNHGSEFGQDAFVDLEELLSSGLVKSEHFHGRDLEALLKNHIDDLASKPLLDDVGLDDSASAVVEGGSGREVRREEQRLLSLVVRGRG